MRIRAAVIASILLALLLPACGSSTTTTVTSNPAGSTTSSTTTPSTSTTTTQSTTGTTSGTTTTTTTAGPAPCVAADLALSFLGQQGATGHGLLGFALRNTSASSCKTFGYPGVLFLDKSGQPLPTEPTHTIHDFFGDAPEVKLVLAPGQMASFRLGVTHGAVPNQPCTTADALQAIAPDDTATLRTPIPDGAFECRSVTVSPLRPGTSAYP